MPLSFNKRAYNLVWNKFMRDQNLQEKVSLDSDEVLHILHGARIGLQRRYTIRREETDLQFL
jgi:hypothetical protein